MVGKKIITRLVVAAVFAFAPAVAGAEEWFRVTSSDGKASVLFPNRANDIHEMTDRTPGGKVVTRVAEHQGEGILMSISETKLPRLAMSFAGPRLIFNHAKGIVLGKVFGYAGLAIILIVDGQLYVVNSMLGKDTPDNQAAQEKLLGSVRIGD